MLEPLPAPEAGAPSSHIIALLRSRVRGDVVTEADPRYDVLRTVVYGGIDSRPVAIARPIDARDVAAVIGVARETRTPLAIRAGGHSNAGHSAIVDGIVVDVRELKDLDIDVPGRTAWAGAGLTAGDVTTALVPHGLAVGFGDTASVGIAGITLGGGVGYLVRKHGLTIDNLLAAEIVTADGEIRMVDDRHDPELFWAVRGGGGNFGIVTGFRYRLQDLPGIVGGLLVLPANAETVAAFVAAAEAAPEELSTIANVMNCPPMPFVPESVHGSVVILATLVWSGDPASGDAALAPFRAIAEPIADLMRPSTYGEIFPPEDQEYHPLAVSRTMFVERIGAAESGLIVDRLETSDSSLRAVQIRVLGGAMARVAPDATAFAHRNSRIMINVAAFYEGDHDRAAREAWVETLAQDLRQDDTGAYVNFLSDEAPERVRAAYPGPTFDRLAAIKARIDPGNMFSRNHNIAPAS